MEDIPDFIKKSEKDLVNLPYEIGYLEVDFEDFQLSSKYVSLKDEYELN